ncbi:ribosomal protein S10 [Pycnococcus provasolii]
MVWPKGCAPAAFVVFPGSDGWCLRTFRPNTNTQTMIVPKSNRTEVYKYLFREGVIYAKKDPNLPKHPEIDVPNLQVIKLLQSLTSRELVKEQYAWQHYYWYLKDEGIEYLREYLNLPEEIVPATLKKSTRPVERRPEGPGGRGPPGGRGGGFGRDSYRGGGDRGPPRGGFGRGAPPA